MRLRITRAVSGSIDGIQLGHFRVGELYEVGTSVGSYLLAVGAAEPSGDDPALTSHSPRWQADDRDPKHRRHPRRSK